MSLREQLDTWPRDRLVKELHAHAKRNAQLEDEASRLRHQVFWLEVRERKLTELIVTLLNNTTTFYSAFEHDHMWDGDAWADAAREMVEP